MDFGLSFTKKFEPAPVVKRETVTKVEEKKSEDLGLSFVKKTTQTSALTKTDSGNSFSKNTSISSRVRLFRDLI